MCPEDLIAIVSALAIAIARDTPSEELPIFAAIFTMLGDTLAVFSTQCEFLEDISKNKNAANNQNEDDINNVC